MGKPVIAIIGAGKVGTTLGILAARAGYTVAGVSGRDADKTAAAARQIGPGVQVGLPGRIARLGELVLITTPDDSIESVSRTLAEDRAFAPGAIVAHCSGATPSSVLAPARELCSCHIGSMHPLQTFPSVATGVAKFPGTYCFCEGDAVAVDVLMTLAADLGGHGVRMSAEGKLLYHASAVLACNYLSALMQAALTTAEKAGISANNAQPALEPLVRATLDHVFAVGPTEALTGPIARGDVELVRRQSEALTSADARLGQLYKLLGLVAVDMAAGRGDLDAAKADLLRDILKQ